MATKIIRGLIAKVIKNKLIILCAILLIGLISSGVESCASKRNYKKQIKALDCDISVLTMANGFKEQENKDLRKSIIVTEEEIVGIRITLRKKEGRIEYLIGKNREWREKVKNMPASVIVIETRRELEIEEIWERSDGILFSLVASRRNLSALGAFTILGERYATLQDAYEAKGQEVAKIEKVIEDERAININLTEQRANDKLIIADWSSKFSLSEGANRQARRKGRKEGGIVGSILGFILGVLIE